jgi:hypothetical protein
LENRSDLWILTPLPVWLCFETTVKQLILCGDLNHIARKAKTLVWWNSFRLCGWQVVHEKGYPSTGL